MRCEPKRRGALRSLLGWLGTKRRKERSNVGGKRGKRELERELVLPSLGQSSGEGEKRAFGCKKKKKKEEVVPIHCLHRGREEKGLAWVKGKKKGGPDPQYLPS